MNVLNRIMISDLSNEKLNIDETKKYCDCKDCVSIKNNYISNDFFIKFENYYLMRKEKKNLNILNLEYWYKDEKTKTFIWKALYIHGNKYIYHKTIYIKSSKKVEIECKNGHCFPQTPNHHLQGSGCRKCASEKASKLYRLSKEEFIKKANSVHGMGRYDYSKVNYVNNRTNVIIICHNHDEPYEFPQTPNDHLQGRGCSKCKSEKLSKLLRMTLEEFIERANEVHGEGAYDYSKVNYIDSQTNVIIICHNHDEPYEFPQTPSNHLRGQGCPICRYIKMAEKQKLTLNEFINRANEIHGIGTYDYSHVKYVDYKTSIFIICPKHGEFPQTPNDHLQGHGCSICGIEKHKLTLEEFIERANNFYGIGTYDYSESEYIDSQTLIKIICPKEGHGPFWRIPTNHLRGSGCSKCNKNKGEESVRRFLTEKGIEFEEQKRFKDCRNILPLPFDFYLPKYNLCIESDGSPHFEPINWSGKYTNEEMKEIFESYQIRDNIKNEYCKKNGITLLRVYNLKAYEEVEKYFQTHKIIKEQEIFNL